MAPPARTRLLLYDAASRGNVLFAPADPERVRIYTCGPTVYRFAHIGNLRTYLLTDLLVRTLRFLGHGTFTVQNITDEGEAEKIPFEVEAMARERGILRAAGDYAAADTLRERIRAAGYDVVDGAKGAPMVRKTREIPR